MRLKTKEGTTKTVVIEIKPDRQTRPPEKRTRMTKQYLQEVATWGVNSSKWKYAKEYCLDRGWEFMILTEKNLNF